MTRVDAGQVTALVADRSGVPPAGHLPVTIRSADRSSVITPFGTRLRY